MRIARVVLVAVLGTSDLFAQSGGQSYSPDQLMGLLLLTAVLPFFIVMVTSFVKITVVLSILRNAVGMPQIPPNQVITGLAIILSVFVMAPVAADFQQRFFDERAKDPSFPSVERLLSGQDSSRWERVSQPIRGFLVQNASRREVLLFIDLSKRLRPPDAEEPQATDLIILMPSFVLTELKEAFLAGFVIFLPFLVIDMIVANILMALGMFMLSPTTISLPIKLLLFVLVDGWYLVLRGLVLSYIPGT